MTGTSQANNIELIRMLNRSGHGIAYSQMEEINTVLCLQKMALAHDNEDPLPEKIQSYVQTTLAWDNIDRLEETLSGAWNSHRVNGLPSKPLHFGLILPQAQNWASLNEEKKHWFLNNFHCPTIQPWWMLWSSSDSIRWGNIRTHLAGSKN